MSSQHPTFCPPRPLKIDSILLDFHSPSRCSISAVLRFYNEICVFVLWVSIDFDSSSSLLPLLPSCSLFSISLHSDQAVLHVVICVVYTTQSGKKKWQKKSRHKQVSRECTDGNIMYTYRRAKQAKEDRSAIGKRDVADIIARVCNVIWFRYPTLSGSVIVDLTIWAQAWSANSAVVVDRNRQ